MHTPVAAVQTRRGNPAQSVAWVATAQRLHTLLAQAGVGLAHATLLPHKQTGCPKTPSTHCPLPPQDGLFPHVHLFPAAFPGLISHLSPAGHARTTLGNKLHTHGPFAATLATVLHTGPLANDSHDVEAPHRHVR